MTSQDKLYISGYMMKQASPRWAKLMGSLSPDSIMKLKNYFPVEQARQIGRKAIGSGMEGSVFPAFVGRHGKAIVKRFDNDLSGKLNIAASEYNIPATYLSIIDKIKAMGQIKNKAFLSVYKPHAKGYFAEALSEASPSMTGWKPDWRTSSYLRDERSLEAGKRLLRRYQHKIDSSNFIYRFIANKLKNIIPSSYKRTAKTVLGLNSKMRDKYDSRISFIDSDIGAARNQADFLNRLFGGDRGKIVNYRDLISGDTTADSVISKFSPSKKYSLTRLQGNNFEGKPLYFGDIDLDAFHNVMLRPNGQYVISDPLLATMPH